MQWSSEMEAVRFPAYLHETKFAQCSWHPVLHATYKFLNEIWPLFIPLIILPPWLNMFPYPSPEAAFSDLSISRYPNALYLTQELIRWLDVQYVIWGPDEWALGGWDPRQAPYLRVIEANAGYAVLEVLR